MSELVLVVIAGFLGGVIRSIVGIMKYQRRVPKSRKYDYGYLFSTLVSSGLIGLMAGLFVVNDVRFAILAGYVGSDFLESLYKTKFKGKYQ